MNQGILLNFFIIFIYVVGITVYTVVIDKNNPSHTHNLNNKISQKCSIEIYKARSTSPTNPIGWITGFYSGLITYILLSLLSNLNRKSITGISILSSVLTFFLVIKGINCWQARTLG